MTVLEFTLTDRPQLIALDAGSFQRLLCHMRLHDWSRWTPIEFVTTEGRKNRTIVVQVRECITCGLSQRKPL